jgi:hypothetical protein
LDTWTSTNGYGFLAITMHWITKDWVLQDSLLDFIDLSGPHSGENLCNAFVKSCQEFGVLKKVKFLIYSFLLKMSILTKLFNIFRFLQLQVITLQTMILL